MPPNFDISLDESPSALTLNRHAEALYQYARKNCPDLPRNRYLSIEVKTDGKLVAGGIFIKHYKLLSIESFWVDEDYQNKKLGNSLYNKIEDWALSEGCEYIVGTTLSFYPGALEFWKKQGGEIFSQLHFEDGNSLYYIRKRLRSN